MEGPGYLRNEDPRATRSKAGRYVFSNGKIKLTLGTEIDRSRASSRKGVLGGSLFADAAPTAPPELHPLITAQHALSLAETKATAATSRFETDDAKAHDSRVGPKSLPARAAQLSVLLATLGDAESSATESAKARKAVVDHLEKMLEAQRAALKKGEEALAGLKTKRGELERERSMVEDAIMRGLEVAPAVGSAEAPIAVDVEALRPDTEPLTPPPVESLTPAGSPKMVASAPEAPAPAGGVGEGAALLELAKEMDKRAAGADGVSEEQPAAKRRRIGAPMDEFDGLQGDVLGNIDPDVAAMLAQH
jgi:regulator of Ty1 transposition protein 103